MSPRKRTTPGQDAAQAVRAARAAKKAEKASAAVLAGTVSFRAFLSSPDFVGEPLDLSPAMWAIVDASDGRPDLIPDDVSLRVFNCPAASLPTKRPRVMGIGAGRRGGKTSRLLAPAALFLAFCTALPNVRDGEVARVAIVAQDIDAATGCLSYVKGLVASSPILRLAVVGDATVEEPEDVGTASGVVLRRPDGKLVDVVVRASSRGGRSVRSRTLAGLVMDEACFYSDGGTSGASNDRAIFDAALPALEPGGQVWIASTPWIEEEGLLEQLVSDNWTNSTQGKTAVVAARVSTKLLRPGWDPDGSLERDARAQADGDLNADREILAIPLKAGSRSYFAGQDVEAALSLVPPDMSPVTRAAGADFAHTSDRSALAVAERYEGGVFSVSLARETVSSPDVKPSEVYSDFARTAKSRGARQIASDGHYKESVREEYERHGVSFKLAGPTDRLFAAGRTLLRERRLALAALPDADRTMLKKQFAAVVVIPGTAGRERVHLPRTTVRDSAQGKSTTHCDALVAVLTALHEVGSDEPGLWAHEEEKRTAAEALANTTYTPRPGSLASLNAYRNGGKVSTGKFW